MDYACTLSVEVKPSDIPDVERGEVLMDSRGRGSTQQIKGWR
jgi:hypothetical protein